MRRYVKKQIYRYYRLSSIYNTEYRNMSDRRKILDMKKWNKADKIILKLSLNGKSKYADYPTKRICKKYPKVALAYTYHYIIPSIDNGSLNILDSYSVGNAAAHLLLLEDESLRIKYEKLLFI